MPVRGDILELTIDSSGFEGTSVARHEGMVVFVEGAVAGDVVRARIYRTKKKHLEAKVVEVLRPSQNRTSPRWRSAMARTIGNPTPVPSVCRVFSSSSR